MKELTHFLIFAFWSSSMIRSTYFIDFFTIFFFLPANIAILPKIWDCWLKRSFILWCYPIFVKRVKILKWYWRQPKDMAKRHLLNSIHLISSILITPWIVPFDGASFRFRYILVSAKYWNADFQLGIETLNSSPKIV